MNAPKKYLMKDRHGVTELAKGFEVVNGTLITQNGLQYKINNSQLKCRTMLYSVSQIKRGAGKGNLKYVNSVYTALLDSVPAQHRRGLKKVLSYQFDIDTSLVKRFGNSWIQDLFDDHKMDEKQMSDITPMQRYKLLFEDAPVMKGENEVPDFDKPDTESVQAVQTFFTIPPETFFKVRNAELVEQTKLVETAQEASRMFGNRNFNVKRGFRGGGRSQNRLMGGFDDETENAFPDEQNINGTEQATNRYYGSGKYGCDCDKTLDIQYDEFSKVYDFSFAWNSNFMDQFEKGVLDFQVQKKRKGKSKRQGGMVGGFTGGAEGDNTGNGTNNTMMDDLAGETLVQMPDKQTQQQQPQQLPGSQGSGISGNSGLGMYVRKYNKVGGSDVAPQQQTEGDDVADQIKVYSNFKRAILGGFGDEIEGLLDNGGYTGADNANETGQPMVEIDNSGGVPILGDVPPVDTTAPAVNSEAVGELPFVPQQDVNTQAATVSRKKRGGDDGSDEAPKQTLTPQIGQPVQALPPQAAQPTQPAQPAQPAQLQYKRGGLDQQVAQPVVQPQQPQQPQQPPMQRVGYGEEQATQPAAQTTVQEESLDEDDEPTSSLELEDEELEQEPVQKYTYRQVGYNRAM